MSNSTNLSCPKNSVPATLPIPQNITYAVIPGSNASDPWMFHCCQPNPVHIVNDCWEWCQVPAAIANHSTASDISQDLGGCLLGNGWNYTQSNGLFIHMSNGKSSTASNNRVTFAGMALVALTVATVFVTMVWEQWRV